MALEIKPTPVLKGKDAKSFLYEIRHNENKKTPIEKINKNVNLFLNVVNKQKNK